MDSADASNFARGGTSDLWKDAAEEAGRSDTRSSRRRAGRASASDQVTRPAMSASSSSSSSASSASSDADRASGKRPAALGDIPAGARDTAVASGGSGPEQPAAKSDCFIFRSESSGMYRTESVPLQFAHALARNSSFVLQRLDLAASSSRSRQKTPRSNANTFGSLPPPTCQSRHRHPPRPFFIPRVLTGWKKEGW